MRHVNVHPQKSQQKNFRKQTLKFTPEELLLIRIAVDYCLSENSLTLSYNEYETLARVDQRLERRLS